LITIGVGAALFLLADTLTLKRLEWLAEDMRLKIRASVRPEAPSGQVVLLAVDELSVKANGKWPFAREMHGQLFDHLGKDEVARPAVMAWDFTFTDPSFKPEWDEAMVAPLRTLPFPVVMGAFADQATNGLWSAGKLVRTLGKTRPLPCSAEALAMLQDVRGGNLPIPGLLETTHFAVLDAQADGDGVVRKIPLVVRMGSRVFPGLVLQTLLTYWEVKPDDVEILPGEALVVRSAKIGERRIPMDRLGRYVVNYRFEQADAANTFGIPTLSYTGDDKHPGVTDRLMVRVGFGDTSVEPPATGGRIVVVGQVATGLTDIGPSPLRGESPKVLFHINAMENILAEDYLRHAPMWPLLAGLLLAGVGAAQVLEKYSFRNYVGTFVFLVVLPTAGGLTALLAGDLMIPLAIPLAGLALQQTVFTLMKIREEQEKRDRIRKMFGSYVSPELVRRMVEARAEPQLGGHEEEITAFFSDIQGFSAFSEVLSPPDLVVLLNEYLGGMTDILQTEGGALDKYIGDAIVAMFGGLVPLPNHAARACEAVAKMQKKQAELRAYWQSQGTRWPPLVHAMRTRIGLNSGEVVVGNMGSHHRFNYTMMGDVVNLAARCESGSKSLGVYSMATENTVRRAREAGCACVFRSLDRIKVKGRREPVEMFEVVGLEEDVTPQTRACLEKFAEARALYLKQAWPEAIAAFTESAKLEFFQPERDAGVESNPSLVMIERCEHMLHEPPPPDWDGVYVMKGK
jgi:adenylate cyclase